MAQARFTQVRLRFARIPISILPFHHGQREQPNTDLPGKSFIQIIMVEGVLLCIVPLMLSDDFLTFYIQIDILHPDVIKTASMDLKMS
jgi:hypothetical protein